MRLEKLGQTGFAVLGLKMPPMGEWQVPKSGSQGR
jgi:hypothetical protein